MKIAWTLNIEHIEHDITSFSGGGVCLTKGNCLSS